ncbi:MAG: diguanylate cyclase, partial [Clostridia bacterium]|nr:diguanylate cyclase [Clostridia bacterium]
DKITKFMPNMDFEEGGTLDEFIARTAMEFNRDLAEDDYSFQWYREEDSGKFHPFFCDYKRLKNEKSRNLGRLFIFEDAILESDPMTGFHNLEPFCTYPNMSYFEYPVVVTCVDINGLSIINNTYGRTAGDQLIAELADRLRKDFPVGTYFIRGTDANLIAICNNAKELDVNKIMNGVRASFSGTFQYSVVVVKSQGTSIVKAIEEAENNVAIWKLMDKESIRSETLNSLISALKECDPDTEAHVQRTQNMGIELSRRIGLPDSEEVNLALLCVLHDIGKIGIPLEILNKPGKLTDEEWELMKTHVDKGYEIAMSSTDYAPIAKAIRHHHERWDGNGYPDGLSKETIPILSRFIAVIDAYDAMISKRPYKRTLSREEAVHELLKNAGTQFDPKVVNEFVQMVTQDDVDFDADIFNAKPNMEDDGERPSSSRRNKPAKLGGEEVHTIPYSRYTLDKDMHIIRHDEAFNELTGYTDEDIRELNLSQGDLIPERNRVLYFAMVSEQLGRYQIAYFEHTLMRKDGSEISVVCMGRNYFDSAVREERSEIIVFDISKTNAANKLYHIEKERAESRLEVWEETFRKDSLTGLFNHSAFVSEVEMKLIENKFKTVLLMIDVDNFKEYNDTYGHRSGDEFLIVTANAIHESLRESDLSGRMGGDEFAAAIFFPKEVSDADIKNRIQEIFENISTRISSVENGTTLSMGAAIATDEHTNFTDLYDAADAALYSSKDAGKNRINW